MRKAVVIVIALALVILALLPREKTPDNSPGKNLTKVTFRMNWKFTAPHAVYLLGKDLGFYEAEGIDLEILEGNGSVTTGQLISNKSDTFGLADSTALVPIMAKGLPIKAVGMVTPKSSLAVIARADSGVRTLKDLEGKKIAVTAGDSITQIWPAVVAVNKLDKSRIQLVYVDAAAKVPTTLEGKTDALMGAADDQSFVLEDNGVPAVSLMFADHGVNILNLGIFVHEDLIKDNPDLIRRFLRATQKSHEALEANYAKALQLLIGIKKELKMDLLKKQADGYYSRMKSPNNPEADMLYNVPRDWDMTVEIMKKYRNLEGEINAEDFYTNDFLPQAGSGQ
ncbi:MAG: ABC transporter substrate-binding protein [Phycisphaerae bacterium]|jgi:NitT/TauT family transport system substrate-binding protein|nr:ABC transporter substrate-binding protein [Phycisphaerae bacterium]